MSDLNKTLHRVAPNLLGDAIGLASLVVILVAALHLPALL